MNVSHDVAGRLDGGQLATLTLTLTLTLTIDHLEGLGDQLHHQLGGLLPLRGTAVEKTSRILNVSLSLGKLPHHLDHDVGDVLRVEEHLHGALIKGGVAQLTKSRRGGG